ncbi:IQ domain-containing protein D [Hondaea fermentalgiana]|uniref:Dynein regulatory complex protein 10 n=1 Tax=Hondaea fermentalgiana TaxID=2315210 RepID=A0A2R5GI76_9STRA|nr:IQ domain-containing protein D [Hondaea fermentalgiana]|eukprot:GBG30592.1 IQ domain-containing protein D [Hondaea fermentalgiana]
MEKLSHVEAQRVIGVLGDTLEQLACLAQVPEHASSNVFQALEARDRREVASCLESQFQYEEALVVAQEQCRSVDTLNQIEKKLRTNTRALCRALRDDAVARQTLEDIVAYGESKLADDEDIDDAPSTVNGSNTARASHLGGENKSGKGPSGNRVEVSSDEEKEQGEFEEGAAFAPKEVTSEVLADWLGGLRNVVFKALTTTVEEEHAEKELLQSVSSRKHEAEEDRSTLESELAIARRNRNRMVSELDAHVRKLETELREIKHAADEEEAQLELEISTKRKALDDEHAQICETLRTEEKKLNEELAKLTTEMEEKETSLGKKKNKAQAEVNGQIDRFDTDLGAKRDELERLRAQFDAESAKLDKLEDHFARVDAENARIAEEEAKWAEYMYEQTAQERARDHGAASVQKLFRGYVARAEVQNLQKKGKKGGKKK